MVVKLEIVEYVRFGLTRNVKYWLFLISVRFSQSLEMTDPKIKFTFCSAESSAIEVAVMAKNADMVLASTRARL